MGWRKYLVGSLLALMPCVVSANSLGNSDYTAAYEAYNRAKTATSLKVSTDAYADAISLVAKAVTKEPERFDYLVLASLIYRGKGGASYAQNYFLQAEKVIRAQIAADPNDIEAHLNYAILCYAGDGQFSQKALYYRREAQKEANLVVRLCQKALKENPKAVGLRRPEAMAYLIKGNKRECKKLLQDAANESDADKIVAELYENTVEKNKWKWDVREVDKEFLLYVMLKYPFAVSQRDL
ncbi:MAG: hypothetical protein IKN43_12570 [Selenomonadaceae bacterium]|nr:hypothetical protein [Selenomonadaceae bacterium]